MSLRTLSLCALVLALVGSFAEPAAAKGRPRGLQLTADAVVPGACDRGRVIDATRIPQHAPHALLETDCAREIHRPLGARAHCILHDRACYTRFMHLASISLLWFALASVASPAVTAVPAVPPVPSAEPAVFPYPGDARRSTHGASIRLVPLGRVRQAGVNEYDYRIAASGFPRGHVYRLWYARLGSPAELLCGALVADSSGSLVPSDSAATYERSICPPLDSLELGASDYIPGEPYRVGVISTDDSVKTVATAFPHPIEGRDGSYRILLEMNSADRRSFTLWGVGFAPNENLRTRITSGGETREGPAFADERGIVRIQLGAPGGQTGGIATYEVIGPAGRRERR